MARKNIRRCKLLVAEAEKVKQAREAGWKRLGVVLGMLAEADYTLDDIAQRLGVVRETVRLWYKRTGIDRCRSQRGRGRKWAAAAWLVEAIFHERVGLRHFVRAADALKISTQVRMRRVLYSVDDVKEHKTEILNWGDVGLSRIIPVPPGEKRENIISAYAAARRVGISRLTFIKYAAEERLWCNSDYKAWRLYRRDEVEAVAVEFLRRRNQSSGWQRWKKRVRDGNT